MFNVEFSKESTDTINIQEVLKKMQINFDEKKIIANMDEQLCIIKQIAKLGFIIPRNVDLDIQNKILNYSDKNELEKLFINFFLGNKKKELIRIKKTFNNYKEMENFKKAYNQAYFNFEHKKYFSACLILTLVLEGVIRYYSNIPNKDDNIHGLLNKNLNTKYKEKYTILFQDKTGISKFICDYFSSTGGNKINSQNYFNRNILMHGLEFKRFKKIDAIKLFNVIDVLNNLFL